MLIRSWALIRINTVIDFAADTCYKISSANRAETYIRGRRTRGRIESKGSWSFSLVLILISCSQLRFSYTYSEITYLIKLVGSSQSEHCVNVKQRTQHDGPWDVISLVSYVFCHMQGNGVIKDTCPGKKHCVMLNPSDFKLTAQK